MPTKKIGASPVVQPTPEESFDEKMKCLKDQVAWFKNDIEYVEHAITAMNMRKEDDMKKMKQCEADMKELRIETARKQRQGE